MPREVTVHVIDYGRKNLYMRYVDPETGQQHARSTGTSSQKEALKKAAQWEAEINEGRYKPSPLISWGEFQDAYGKEFLSGLAPSTREKVHGVLDAYAKFTKSVRLSDAAQTRKVSQYQAARRREGLAETTIQVHTSHLRAAFRWAHDMGYLTAVPKVPKIHRTKSKSKMMKGRPLSLPEFVRVLRAVPVVVGPERAPAWQRYLKGLFCSGLRLEESIPLSWDDPTVLMVDFSGRRPMLRVRAEQEKGFKDRILPMAPEFAKFLERTPKEQRTGPVFKFPAERPGRVKTVNKVWVSKTVSDFGKEAGIVVDETSGKYASAHDLRRTFGERWSLRVMPAVLQQLMRHESIETTMKFYVGENAAKVADALWNAASVQQRTGNTSSNYCPTCGRKIDATQDEN